MGKLDFTQILSYTTVMNSRRFSYYYYFYFTSTDSAEKRFF